MTTFKNKVGADDIQQWDGVNRTFDRPTSSGGTLTQPRIGNVVDVLQVYGDGETVTEAALTLAISQIGSNEACLELAPGSWPITANLTPPANLTFRLRRGATFAVSGGITLDLSSCPVFFEEETWYTGAGTVSVTGRLVRGPGKIISVEFNTSPGTITSAEGKIWWDATNATLAVGLGGDSIIQVGNELFARVKNNTGGTLDSGDMVYVSGAQGDRAEVTKAQANAVAPAASVLGMVTQEILDSASGFVTIVGEVRDVDTSGMTEGDAVYLSTSVAGGFTKTQPTDTGGQGNYLVRIGTATKIGASSGIILLALSPPVALDPQMTADTDLVPPSQKAVKAFAGSSGALVSNTTDTTTSSGNPTFVSFDTEIYDDNGWHESVTNPTRLTVPSGVSRVRVFAQILWKTDGTETAGSRIAAIYKNGVLAYGGCPRDSRNAVASPHLLSPFMNISSPPINVSAGDYFEVYTFQTGNGNIQGAADGSTTWFAIEKVPV